MPHSRTSKESRSRSRSRSSSPRRGSRRPRSRSRSVSMSPSDRKKRGSSRDRYYPRSRSYSPRKRNNRFDPEPAKVLGIFGLSYHTNEHDLSDAFSRFGEIDRVRLVRDPDGRSRGFGFINFVYMEDAREAKRSMCDKIFQGKKIRVDYSISNGPHPKTPGRYLGHRGRSRYDDHHYRDRSPRRSRYYSPRRY